MPKNILICPLDWGLGHATRCVPVIQKFIEEGANVFIGSDKRPLAFLRKEFTSLTFIPFPGYDITYPDKGSMVIRMFLLAPIILLKIRKERRLLQKIITDNNIDIVISDNRYGLWNKNVKCIFITHQLSVKCPKWLKFLEIVLFRLNKHYIQKYDECWIPDIRGFSNFTGSLTKNYERIKNVHFIGLLSRFDQEQYINATCDSLYDALFILSGPEPQRTVFENIILDQLKKYDQLKVLIVRGITETSETRNVTDNVQMVTHLDKKDLAKVISQSKLVICRPGYSSVMDLVTLGKNAFFVPTPGQTEQEYLARYYHQRNLFFFSWQHNFDILKAIQKSVFSKGIKIKNDPEILKTRIHSLLS